MRLPPARIAIAFPGRVGSMQLATPVNPTQAETTALLAAMTVQPSADRANLINNTIFNLKNAGLWTTFDLLHPLAAHDAQAARVNWRTPAQVASVNGSPTFTTDRGYVGDGTTGWLGTGVNLNALTQCTQNNCSLGLFVGNNATSTGSAIGLPTSNLISLNPRSATDQMSSRMMTATQTNLGSTDSSGHWVLTRSNAAGYDRYRNAALLDSPVATSGAPVAEQVVYLRTPAAFSSNHVIACVHVGSSLSPAQISSLGSILNTYLHGVGVL